MANDSSDFARSMAIATSGLRAITTTPPTSIAMPSTRTAPPGPSHAVRPAVINPPSGSSPTKAPAQIALTTDPAQPTPTERASALASVP